ncbi:MAG: hypothetical protein V3R85_11055 [Alphaproteobacteria bacterium]
MIVKLVVLIALIAIVWYGFRLIGRRERLRGERGASEASARKLEDAQETTRCASCGTFVPTSGARDCGRDGCPYPD